MGGPEETEFEERFAKEIGVKYAVGVGSGSSALYLALVSLGIGPGDEVITTPYTWIITTNAIVSTGATPIFVDVNSDYNISPEAVENAITSKTRAIVPVHVSGHMCDMKSLSKIAKNHKLLIVEDAAQAFCARLNGKRAGSFSHAAGFSMNPMKILHAYGEAGAVVTNNKKVYETIKQLRHAGTKRYLNKNHHINRANFIALNHKIDTLQASLLLEEMDRIEHIRNKREKIAIVYDKELLKVGCQPQPVAKNEIHGRYNYMFSCNRRNKLSKYLLKQKIENKIWYSPLVCDARIYRKKVKEELPEARLLLTKNLSIPLHEDMSIEQAEYVVDHIRNFYG